MPSLTEWWQERREKRTNASFKFGFKKPKVILDMTPAIEHKKTLSYNKNIYIQQLPLIDRFKIKLNRLFIDKSRRLEIFHIKK